MTAAPTPSLFPGDFAAEDGGHGVAVWSTPQWRERATAWADDALAGHGIRRTGPAEQPHLRPWSTVLRLPTSAGSVWLKAPGPGLAVEVSLYAVLARHAPDLVLVPYAVDEARSWLLLPDGGAVLATNTTESLEVWATALEGYARLQLALTEHVGEALAVGVPDHRPERLGVVLEETVTAARVLARTAAEQTTLDDALAARSRLEELAGVLAASPHRPTVQHDDLHRDNVFLAGARVFDWGDAVVAHPFASLLVALRDTAEPFGVGQGDPRVVAARDAYLAPFGGPTAANLRDVAAARQVGVVSRAANWLRAIESCTDEESADVRSAPIHWLGMLGDDDHP